MQLWMIVLTGVLALAGIFFLLHRMPRSRIRTALIVLLGLLTAAAAVMVLLTLILIGGVQ